MTRLIHTRARFMIGAVIAFIVLSIVSSAHAADPQGRLKDADRLYRAGDTPAAIRAIRECVADPQVREWMVEEAVKFFAGKFRLQSDGPLAMIIFSEAFRSPKSQSVVPSLLNLLQEYPALGGEEKLSVLSGLAFAGDSGDALLEIKIQMLRRLSRHEPAIEMAAQLASRTSRLEHRVMVADLLLDLSRTTDAVNVSNAILRDVISEPTAYAMLAERFYRHGDYRNALDIHRRARQAFSNPMLFFDQSLSICQGLQLGRDGVELYLPALSGGMIPVPQAYNDFIDMISDSLYLTTTYPAMLASSRNPNLYLAALPRLADIAGDQACLDFTRRYRELFNNEGAHVTLAEHLLDRPRRQLLIAVLQDIPDTPPDVAEAKRHLLFKDAIRTRGPDAAGAEFPPPSFATPAIRAAVFRGLSSSFFTLFRLPDAIAALTAAQAISSEPRDSLRLAKMYFLSGMDSEARASAFAAHRMSATDETLYWLGWLSYLNGDSMTARQSFRDAVLRSENFLADESLAWIIVSATPDKFPPADVGRAMREAYRGKDKSAGDWPVAVQVAVCRTAIESGLKLKKAPSEGSAYLRYLRWKSLDGKERTEENYQQLLKQSPEFLRALIRTEEP